MPALVLPIHFLLFGLALSPLPIPLTVEQIATITVTAETTATAGTTAAQIAGPLAAGAGGAAAARVALPPPEAPPSFESTPPPASAAQCTEAVNNITNGLPNISGESAGEVNLQGNGGIAGAQSDFQSLTTLPGSSTQTYPNGAQVVRLPDGTNATLYQPSNSGGSPIAIQVKYPDGTLVKIKY